MPLSGPLALWVRAMFPDGPAGPSSRYANATELSDPLLFRHCACPPGVLHPAVAAPHVLLSPEIHPISARAPLCLC